MIFYKLIQNKNEEMPKAYQKWYARPVVTETIDLDYIAERIQRSSTAKKSDAKAVLTEMVEVITDALQSSQRVHIDGFGSFKVGISSRGADSEEDYSAAEHVRGRRIIFQPETQTDPSTRKRSKKMLVGATLSNINGLVAKKEEPNP
jgi:predicted histone-like DNA-binding protein